MTGSLSELDLGSVVIPNYDDVDVVLDMACGGDPLGDIRVIKEASFDPGTNAYTDFPIIEGFGSSNVRDTDNDTFHESALKSLCTIAKPGMNTWRNHKFEVPNDLMGSLIEPPTFKYGTPQDHPGAIKPDSDNWAGVWIKSDVEMRNPPAKLMYDFVQPGPGGRAGRRFGWSVGCMYTKYKRKNDGRGAVKGFDVFEASPVEWSIVGVPANQQSWVETTRKHFVRKGIIPRSENDPEMAYVFKHWDEFGIDAPRIRKFAEEVYDKYGLVWAEPLAKLDRESWQGGING